MKFRISKYSEKVIRDHIKNEPLSLSDDLKDISWYQVLSEDFIREFKYKLNWYFISRRQKLSEDFIREFKNEVRWASICQKQVLSDEFIIEHKDYVSWGVLSWCRESSRKFKYLMHDKVYIKKIKTTDNPKEVL